MASIVTIDGLPVYQAVISDEQCGMLRISLVDDPAVQSNFVAFSKNQQPRQLMYAVQNEDKRLVLGVVMRADFPILRRQPLTDDKEVEFYIIYKADTIRTMAEKYLAENRQNFVNIMHEKGSEVEGVQMVQYFIKGAGLNPEGFDNIADGSLFAEFHVTNDEVWNAIKDGTYRGFSLEGLFDLEPETDKGFVQEVVDTLDGIFSRIFKHSKTYKNMKMKGLLARLAKALVEMGNLTTDKGILAWDGEDELKVGDAVFIEDSEGNRSTPADGDYTTEDGRVIVVAGGKVTEIREAGTPAPAPQEPTTAAEMKNTINTDKGVLYYEGELVVGTDVNVAGENGEEMDAPDGEYIAEDGRTIVVADGKVIEIKEAASAPQPQVNTCMQRVAEAFQETYDDKLKKIYNAIVSLGFNYPCLVEAGEEFVIALIWSETDGNIYYRFNITEWTEAGEPVLENGIKVVPAFVTPEEKVAAEENFSRVQQELDNAQARVTELEAQVAELSAKPKGQPAHVEHNDATAQIGNKGLDRLATLMGAK